MGRRDNEKVQTRHFHTVGLLIMGHNNAFCYNLNNHLIMSPLMAPAGHAHKGRPKE